MGRLLPLGRFCLLKENGMHYSEGIRHADYLSGYWDPSVSINRQKSTPRILVCDPEIRPWRNLPAMLAFLDAENAASGFDCAYLLEGLKRLKFCEGIGEIGIWCGGFRVSNNSGEQYASGNDDFVESEFKFDLGDMQSSSWYGNFQQEMNYLENCAKALFRSVASYMKAQRKTDALANTACGFFWEKAENYFPELVAVCRGGIDPARLKARFRNIAREAYDAMCPCDTGRQMQDWVRYRPFCNPGKGTDKKKGQSGQKEEMREQA